MSVSKILIGAALVLGVSPASATATPLTCPTTGTYSRQATLDGAIACVTVGQVSGTPKADDVEALFGGSWIEAGTLSKIDGTDDWLTSAVTSGAWGSLPVAGTWAIASGFWDEYPRAVISFHLGGGAGDPDWFFFEIGPGATNGTFSVNRLTGSGGGFSNIVLWADPITVTAESSTPVPEPATLALLGAGLVGGAIVLRRRKRAAASESK